MIDDTERECMLKTLKKDVIAGFCVFLLALPLCLGIATLSNFPPIAGIITAVIGGILGGFLGGAPLSIKGPAAGLVAIVIGSVVELGYQRTLAVGVIAGTLQIMLGLLRKAVIVEIMPPFVIHGMLAAIGVVIVSKQSYTLMGVAPIATDPLTLLWYLPTQILQADPIILTIGLLSLGVVIVWPKIKKVSVIPSSVIILLSAILGSYYFNFTETLKQSYFIHLPLELSEMIQFPDFSAVFGAVSLKYIAMFVIVGSIESSLTVCAIDAISNQKRPVDLNRDLWVVGVGNLLSSLIGGLPMISEIVRSKANIDYGATSAKANIAHGFFLLGAVCFFAEWLNYVPLSALAALLIFVGLKLTSPKEFIHAYRVGTDQFIIFLTTFLLTLATDLLIGALSGILTKMLLLMIRGNSLKQIFLPTMTATESQGVTRLQIEGPLTFVSYLKLKNMVKNATKTSKKIIISLYEVTYLDHTALKKLLQLKHEFHEVEVTIEENQELVPFYEHRLSARGTVRNNLFP